MKFSVTSGDLQKCLGSVGGVIPTKSTMPILENFLFELQDDELRVTATDLEISMSVTVKVTDGQAGKMAVPAKKMMETIRALPLTPIEFIGDPESNRIEMRTENGVYKLTGESSENYPAISAFEGKDEFTMDSESLRRLISKAIFAVSSDELRPAMMGVLFQMKKDEIRSVATDGHRLVRFINKKFPAKNIQRDVIIPAKALHLVTKSIESGDVTVAFGETHAKFSLGNTVLISRTIEEKYPNYESVLPQDNDKKLTIGKEALLSSVRRTALYANLTTRQVRFSLKKSEASISAEDIDFGSEAREKIAAEYAGDALDIGFNSNYVIDVLSHIDTERVTFSLSTPSRAAIVHPEQQREGEDVLMLVMPVRLNS